VCVFGELFGGCYPHESVSPVSEVQPVQTGVYYCPDVEFYAYDILVEEKAENGQQKKYYIDYGIAMEIFKQAGLFYALPLFIGKYEECMDYQLGFNSTLPEKLGLPPLREKNQAEGIVIKPLKEINIPTKKGSMRAIVKKKAAEFSEDARYHQAEKWAEKPVEKGGVKVIDMIMWETQALITQNRLNNAISKIGNVTLEDKPRVRQLFDEFVMDILEQIGMDNEDVGKLYDLEKEELLKMIKMETEILMKKHFVQQKHK